MNGALRKEACHQKGNRTGQGLGRVSRPTTAACWQAGRQVAECHQSKASPEMLDSRGPSSMGVQCPRQTPGSTQWPQPLAPFHIFLLSPFPVECRDTTRYCEKVKQLKLCQLSQFKSRCCGTCGKA